MVLLSTHSICFGWEIRKLIFTFFNTFLSEDPFTLRFILSLTRALYAQFIDEMIIKPGACEKGDLADVTFEDHVSILIGPDTQDFLSIKL